ncbi:MAG: hypothetical protein NTV28_11860 [Propionibacteriales bacterium]|nr:hypothetical protein [Propionibacteriales bacterium]
MSLQTAHTVPAAATDRNRLTLDDDLFVRAHRVLGIPVVNQTVWRFDRPLDPAGVERLDRGLREGPLARAIRTSRVPGARDTWVPSSAAGPVHVETAPLHPGEVLGWAEERAAVNLDPWSGPTWSLATARTTDGGSVLSYLTPHVVCDGGAHVAALVAAVDGGGLGRLPAEAPVPTVRDDVRDAARQVGLALRGGATAVRAALTSSRPPRSDVQTSRDGLLGPDRPGDDAPRVPATVVVDLDARAWDEAAARHGGTSNSLLVAVAVEVLLASGRVEAGRPVRVSLPVSLRGTDDLRSNATSGVSIDVETGVEDGVGRVVDLGAVRAQARSAYASLASGPRDPLGPLTQLLPDPAVAVLARGVSAPLCLCSNLGQLPATFAAPLGRPATSVLMRSVTQGVTPAMLRRTRGGLTVWWARHGGTATLAVLGVDPDHLGDRDELTRLVVDTTSRWGVGGTPW